MDPVARVELWHVGIPLPAPFRPAWLPGFPQLENRCTVACITTKDGLQGWAAGPALGRERAGLGDLLGPYLIGEDSEDLDVVQQRLREVGYLGWRNWWLEPAFWDIAGKRAGLPVHRLLGATSTPPDVGVYASTGEVRGPSERIAEVEDRAAEGFDTVKLRVHRTEAEDLAQVRAVAREVDGRVRLGVDANQAWRVTAIGDAPLWDLARARRFADACADMGVAWLEEPLAMDAYDDLAALTASTRLPIAGGELHTAGEPELVMMARRGCYDVFQPDAVFTGGIAQTHRIVRRVLDLGLRYTPHTWTNGVGMAVNLQVFLASGVHHTELLEYPVDPPGWVPQARDGLLTEPFVADRGRLTVPTGPGLGITIDPVALRRHGTRFFAMDKVRLVVHALRDRGLRASREIDAARRARRAGAASAERERP